MKCHIYLFRHGQSTFNKQHKFTGWMDARLTKKGYTDALAVGKKLKHVRIDLAFCSHLTRSKETLKSVLQFHPECKKIIVDDRIIERNYGELQGKTHERFMRGAGTKISQVLKQWHWADHLTAKEKKDLIDDLGSVELQIVRRSYRQRPPGGESVADVEKRVNLFIKDLFDLVRKEKVNVAISAHGNSMRPLRKHFEKLSVEEMMRLENPWDDFFHYTISV